MIFDDIKNAGFYHDLGPNFKKALQFLKETDNLIDLPLGRLEIDGERVFALVQEYESKTFNKDMWEAHKKYMDIQYMVKGGEKIKIARIENCKPITPYNEKDDYWLFSAHGDEISLSEGQFVIFAPEDVHQPGLMVNGDTQKIRKIVVKAMI